MPVQVQPKFISQEMTTDQELSDAIALMADNISFQKKHEDSFGRLITAQPSQVGSFDHKISKLSTEFDEVVVGSASAPHNANNVSVDMTTTTGATDSVIRQTYRVYEYIRGNGQLFFFSLNPGGPPKANNVRYFGAGDSENGALFKIDGTSLKVVQRSKVTGSVVDLEVAQSSFNVDRLDGSGGVTNPSGVTLDLSKQHLAFIRYSWQGTNIVEFGFVVGGEVIICHSFKNSNNLAVPWCQSGSLPMYFENTNTGVTGSETVMRIVCCSCYSVGSTNTLKKHKSISSGVTPFTINATEKVVAGIRIKPGVKYVGIEPTAYQVLPVSGTGVAYYRILQRATLTGDTWASTSDIAEGLTNNPTYSGGFVVEEGYFNLSTASRVVSNIQSQTESFLGKSINGTPDNLILVVRTDSGSGSFYFVGGWEEIT